jgi:hypothetical protein
LPSKARRGVAPADLRRIALGLPEAIEAPHFEATSFRVNKKIFATLGEAKDRAVVKLTREQQEMMCAATKSVRAGPVMGQTRLDLHAFAPRRRRHRAQRPHLRLAQRRTEEAGQSASLIFCMCWVFARAPDRS